MFLYLNLGGSNGSTGMADILMMREDGMSAYFFVCSEGTYLMNFSVVSPPVKSVGRAELVFTLQTSSKGREKSTLKR